MRSAGCLLTAGFLGSGVLRSTNFPISEPSEPRRHLSNGETQHSKINA